ncbi:MAG: hypothetical protein IKB72_02810 [Ruminococcus sp.]|nr:hypothetical protein [Ruminococcus sp.]
MAVAKNKVKRVAVETEPAPKPTRKSAELEKLMSDLNKKFGANCITLGVPKDEEGNIKSIERLSTGSIALDLALGGGIPEGRFIELSGAYSSTKTTQALHIIREAQKKGYVCALVDVEGTTDEAFLEALGVDVSTLLYSQPDGMEEACQLILDMQKSGEVQLCVLDSIAAMSPNKEQETAMEDTIRMGIPQQILGEFFRKFQANNNRLNRENKTPFTLIGINQLREKIGAYGDPEYTPGGRAKGFACSVDIRLRRGDWITEGVGNDKEIVGQVVKFKIEKNKTFKRMQTGEFDFYFADNNAGVPVFYNDNEKEIVMCGVEWGIIERTGSWFVCFGQKYQGLTALVNALKSDPEMVQKLKSEVLKLIVHKDN